MQDKQDGPFREPELPRIIKDYLASNMEVFAYVRSKLPDLLGEGSELDVHIPLGRHVPSDLASSWSVSDSDFLQTQHLWFWPRRKPSLATYERNLR